MTFKENVVVVVKANGQILRETGDTVTLPFGCEYSILIKNLNSVRIQTKVSIDGVDATESTRLIVQPNSSIELERFIKGGNLQAGNRFKFIERTAGIEQHRGIKADDGIVRVESWVEYIQPVVNVPIVHYYNDLRPYHHPWNPCWPPYRPTVMRSNVMRSNSAWSGSRTSASEVMRSAAIDNINSVPSELNCDAGITVAGSQSNQQFHSVLGFQTDPQSRVVVLRLRGEVGGIKVRKAVTVKCKPKCVTCGKSNKGGAPFCSSCGTALVII